MANTWTWVPVEGAVCRNGSATGFGVRLNPASDKLVIYFEGGGACFNGLSCAGNPSAFGVNNFASWAGGSGNSGILSSSNPANPVRDWNAVYIPYCTGDVHGGSATGVNVPGFGGPQNQSFVGYRNVGLFMARIAPTFPSVTQVLVTGISAGGFGAMLNYHRIAQDLCPRTVMLVDDSGPPLSDTYLAPCLQQRWRTLWNLGAALPPDCPQATGSNGGGLANALRCLGDRYGDTRLGLISSTGDSTITQVYGFGLNNCANLDGFGASLSAGSYTAGLQELRSAYLNNAPAWGTYFIPGNTHTFLGGGGFYNTSVAQVPLSQWVTRILQGEPSTHVGP